MTVNGADQVRREIDHAVDQTIVSAGSSIMQFVGMKHDNVACIAEALDPTIAESLHAMEGQSKPVRVMAMR